MKIGMNMHLWSTHVTAEHFADIERLREIGYEGIEIFLAEPNRAGYENVGSFLRSIDMEVNGCLGLGPEQNPISADASVRRAALDKLREAIDNMHAAGGKNIRCAEYATFGTAELAEANSTFFSC